MDAGLALVTGAAGFIGSHLVERAARARGTGDGRRLLHRLLRPGAQARATLAAALARPALPPARAGPRRGRPRRACPSADVGVPPGGAGRRARLVGRASSRRTRTTTCSATQRLLERCRDGRLRALRLRLVLVGLRRRRALCRRAEDALPRPFSPYGVTKLAGEHLALLYAPQLRRAGGGAALLHGLRPAPAPGHGVPPLHAARCCAGEPITVYGDGEQTRDFTFVADAVEATFRALERGGGPARSTTWAAARSVEVQRGWSRCSSALSG